MKTQIQIASQMRIATQIQLVNSNTTKKHKHNMAKQMQHRDTNNTWLHKYNMATQIQHDNTNTTWLHTRVFKSGRHADERLRKIVHNLRNFLAFERKTVKM